MITWTILLTYTCLLSDSSKTTDYSKLTHQNQYDVMSKLDDLERDNKSTVEKDIRCYVPEMIWFQDNQEDVHNKDKE